MRLDRRDRGGARQGAGRTNPEKLLTATIRSSSAREADRTFRYAPLAQVSGPA
jgi:hypothetical protein